MITVEPGAWRSTLQDARDRGMTCLDLLTAVDRGTHVDVIVLAEEPGGLGRLGVCGRLAAGARLPLGADFGDRGGEALREGRALPRPRGQ